MKKLIFAVLAVIISAVAFAYDTQTGYVKTRGRQDAAGKVIPGKRLPDATVVLQSGSAVQSDGSGEFSLRLPSASFRLKDVKKKGYVVSDPDMLARQYSYSANPLILVLDEPGVQQDDRLASERRLRRSLQRSLQEREDELEALKEENKITKEQYRDAMQKLYADQESNEKFISEMAERYSKLDFDQLDEFQRRMAMYIQNGELTRADSLLRTKGSMKDRLTEIENIGNAIEAEEKEIARRQANVGDSRKMRELKISDYAADCYHYYEINKLKLDFDSAGYWLEQRAMVDTLNFNYVWECGNYFMLERKYDKALEYFKMLSRNSTLEPVDLAMALNDLAICQSYLGHLEKGLEAISRSMEIREELARKEPEKYTVSLALVYSNYAFQVAVLGQKELADRYFKRGMALFGKLAGHCPFFKVNLANVQKNYGQLLQLYSADEDAGKFIIESYKARNEFAGTYPDFYNTTRNIPLDEIGVLVGECESDSLILTKECKMILRSAAVLNKEQMTADSWDLAAWFFAKDDLNSCERYLNDTKTHSMELFESNPAKFLPDIARYYSQIANFCLFQLGDAEEAGEVLDTILGILNRYDTWQPGFSKNLELGNVWIIKGLRLGQSDPDEAIRCFETAIGFLEPEYAAGARSEAVFKLDDASNAAASAYFAKQDPDNAVKFNRKRVSLYADDAPLAGYTDLEKAEWLKRKNTALLNFSVTVLQTPNGAESLEPLREAARIMKDYGTLFTDIEIVQVNLMYANVLLQMGLKDELNDATKTIELHLGNSAPGPETDYYRECFNELLERSRQV